MGSSHAPIENAHFIGQGRVASTGICGNRGWRQYGGCCQTSVTHYRVFCTGSNVWPAASLRDYFTRTFERNSPPEPISRHWWRRSAVVLSSTVPRALCRVRAELSASHCSEASLSRFRVRPGRCLSIKPKSPRNARTSL